MRRCFIFLFLLQFISGQLSSFLILGDDRCVTQCAVFFGNFSTRAVPGFAREILPGISVIYMQKSRVEQFPQIVAFNWAERWRVMTVMKQVLAE